MQAMYSSISHLQSQLGPKALFASMVLLVGGCVHAPSISSHDSEAVLISTASELNKKLNSGYCIAPKLDMKGPQWAGQVDKDGWITAPNDKTMRYHPLPAPEITTLPHSALEALSNAKPGANCNHVIVFARPQFIEIRTQTESYIEADVNFSDRCPLCGYGAIARFRKIAGGWRITPEKIEGTWVS